MKKYIHEILGIILAISVIIGDIFYILYGALWRKGLTSGLFFLLGVNFFIALLFKKKNIGFSIFMLIGLLFTMIADIVLNIQFIAGAILFAIGHIFYGISYTRLHKLKWLDFICSVVIALPSVLWITISPMFDYGGVVMEVVAVMYAMIISCMVGKAVSNWISAFVKKQPMLLELTIMIGSILFFFSDCMLLLNVFANFPKVVDVLCLATYYPAQIFLATSIYIYKRS